MTLSDSLCRLFAHISRRRRWQLAGLIVLMLIGAAAEMAALGAVVPFLALLADPGVANRYPMLEEFLLTISGHSNNILLNAALLFSLGAISAASVRIALMWVAYRFTYGLGADIGGEVYRRVLHQPYSWHVSKNSSEILAGIQKVNAVINGVIVQVVQGGVSLMLSLGIVITLLAIDSFTALIAAAGFTFFYSVTTLFGRRRLRDNGTIIAENETQRVQAVQEGLGGIRDVILDSSQAIYHRRFHRFDYGLRRAQASNAFIAASPRFLIESSGMVLIAVMAYLLAGEQGGLATAIPVLGALAIGAQKLLPHMQQVYAALSSITGARKQLEDVLELLERPIVSELNLVPIAFRGDAESSNAPLIALRNLSFQYHECSADVLRGINLQIHSGERIGVVGTTGSGKSTLIDLIMGLLDATAGEIEINGRPLTPANRRAWQARIAHVPQTIYLSDATIAENIAFGTAIEKRDSSRVREAARQAQLADFIETLPQQYETRVGERGIRLSGGQRQRIGIARGLYKKAELLILDEATSALDSDTESRIIDSLLGIRADITIIMIAHRLTTLRACDWIAQLDAGVIKRTVDYDHLVGLNSQLPQQSAWFRTKAMGGPKGA